MSLCLIDVHGDIEGDFEWVEDLPENREEFLIAIDVLEKLKEEINEYCKDFLCTPQPEVLAAEINKYIIDKHISRLKGEREE